ASAPSFENRFVALPKRHPFRPARTTPRPRIAGIQQALVTAEEISLDHPPEINVDSNGDVRVRFPWDLRPKEHGVASSRLVRVAHYWAGPGYGALHHPRVGHTV